MPSGSPAFKIKFELKDYNVENSVIEENDNYTSKSDGEYFMIIAIIAILAFLSITIGLYVLVAVMAQRRNRSAAMWVLLSLFATPLLIVIILLFIGDSERYEGY